ncbi:ABC transporter substrate-binding protein [bacterium]|nr:ABC transporter substrate-binding protein [bacterium]
MKRTIQIFFCIFFVYACGKTGDPVVPSGGTVVIALSSDADMLNPLLSSGSNTGIVLEFLFPDLAEHDFDSINGIDRLLPSLANSWEWINDGRSLVYHLRNDALWSDSVRITSHDIKFSYGLYDHPKVASPRRNYLNFLVKNNSGQTDFDRAIETPDDSTIIFNFSAPYHKSQQLLHTQLSFIPKHIFESLDPEELRTSLRNLEPVTGKHFKFSKWERKQELVLVKNANWKIPYEAHVDRVVFRIIPEMTTRIIELKTGAVDMVEGLSPEDAKDIQKNNPNLRIETQPYRRFEYVGWSNIDVELYKTSKGKTIRPHRLFGNKNIRTALTMAIQRDELAESWLGSFGQISTGPISPAFRWAFNDTLRPIPYDPARAKSLLAEEGWIDHDGDGVLDKDGKKFEFVITTNSANPRREFAMQKIQSDLKKIGVVCYSRLLESSVFNSGLRNKEYDAFITGNNVNMSIDLQPQFGSDLERNTFNAVSYRNREVDSLLQIAASIPDVQTAGPVFKELQKIIYYDQPVTFLYWYDNIVGINQRLRGTHVNILSPYHRYYDWYISDLAR